MEHPAQFVAARLTRTTPATITPCVRVNRAIEVAARASTSLTISLMMKFIYNSGTTIFTLENTPRISATTRVLNFDAFTCLVRAPAVSLPLTPDVGTLLVATVKIGLIDPATNLLVEMGETHTATFNI